MQSARDRKHRKIRAKISGTALRPRLCVFKSNTAIYAQLIDDAAGRTLAASSDKDVSEKGKPVETAKIVGMKLAEKAKAAGIEQVVFDRGSNRYIGRVAALAEGAREGGLNF